MEASLRPHRGGSVLALGILGLVPLVGVIPFGIPAWVMGSKDLRGMDLQRVDPTGRRLTQAGRVCGIVGTVIWLMLLPTIVLMFSGRGEEWCPDPSSAGTGITTMLHPNRTIEWEFGEALDTSGQWVKDSRCIHWNAKGQRLESGEYRMGRRTGTWTFWNEDGSVDHARSGVYENDVKVRD